MSFRTANLLLASISAAVLMAVAGGSASAESFGDGVAAQDRGDYAGALRIFSAQATADDAMSQFALAEMYRQGQGVRRDDGQALTWYRKAAEHANPGAEYRIGLAYQAGQGAPRSDQAAAQWYAKAAAHGFAGAELKLGILYAEGRGVPRSDQTATAWLQKAADQGDADARARLGEMTRLSAMASDNVRGAPIERFRAMMDRVFGAGHWRETSGFRSVAQEDELRREGAGTVRLGELSRHSMGDPSAPGAYDIVVAGMSLQLAAAKLKHSGEPLARVFAEEAHGSQGPHLHVEPLLTRVSAETAKPAHGAPVAHWTYANTPSRLLAIAAKPAAAQN